MVQLYVGEGESSRIRPVRELKGFEKIFLKPGEARDVSFTPDKRSLAYWNTQIHDWHVETGAFSVEIGRSSRDIALRKTVTVTSTVELPRRYDENSIFMDLLADPRAAAALKPLLDGMRQSMAPSDGGGGSDAARDAISDEMSLAMLQYMPLRGILSFGGDEKAGILLSRLLAELNKA